MFRATFALVTAFCLSLSPLAAATVTTTTPDLVALQPGSLGLPTGANWTVAPDTRSGDEYGRYLSPFFQLGAGNYETTPYWNVAGLRGKQTAELTFGGLQDALSFLWGSPDSYNLVTLFNGLTETATVRLADLNTRLITVGGGAVQVAISGVLFDRVTFFSETPAFELANISSTPVAPIPVPAAGLMLLLALGGLAALRQRKASL